MGDGLFRIRLNNPVGSLLVNTYAYRTSAALVIIDPGWPWTLDALEHALRDLGLARSLTDVTEWLYTHTHIDHMGAAALLAEYSDSPHYAYAGAEPYLEQWHTFQDRMNDWTAWANEAFDDPATKARLRTRTRARVDKGIEFLLEPHGERAVQNAVLVDFGETLRVADLELEFHDARGHDPLHGVFYEPSRRWLFGGDVVIATVTPISRAMDDALGSYLDTLARLAALDVDLLLPGHGVQRSGDLASLFQRSRAYQDEIRRDVLRVLHDATEPLGLLALGLRASPDGKPLEPESRWAVYLALFDSHVHQLIAEGRVEKVAGPRYLLVR